MTGTVFLAGATGVIGRRMIPLLQEKGWTVVGGTRSQHKVPDLEKMGVIPAVGDAFCASQMDEIVALHRPTILIHQLTDLPDGLDPQKMAAARVRNSRLRIMGTHNLVAAAVKYGVERFIAQSISFSYARGIKPYVESCPLEPKASGVRSLEQQVLDAPFNGIVLRYGHLYGPGTGFEAGSEPGSIHVDAAASAAVAATEHGRRSVYNIAEDDGEVSIEKACRELDWQPQPRLAKEPRQNNEMSTRRRRNRPELYAAA